MKKKENELNKREKEIKDVAYKFNNWRREERKRTETAYTRADKAREEQERLLEKKELEIEAGVKQGIKKNWQTIVQSFVKALSEFAQIQLDLSEILLFIYAIAATIAIGTGFYKTYFRNDLISVGKRMATAFVWLYKAPISHIAKWISHFIPNAIILTIVYWVLVVILCLMVLALIAFAILYIILWHKEYCKSIVTWWIGVLYFIAMFFWIEYIPINAFLLFFTLMFIYMIVCGIYQVRTCYRWVKKPNELVKKFRDDMYW